LTSTVCPSRRLGKLERKANRRLERLRRTVDSVALPATAEKDRAVAWVVIEARNLWSEFLRAYYLSAAIRTRTISGIPVSFVTRTFPNTEAALAHSVRLLRRRTPASHVRRQDEPAWHVVTDYLSLCRNVGFSNIGQIVRAFSYPTDFFQLLTPVRNFYSHRCDETFRKASHIGIKLGLSTEPDLRPVQILCSRLPARPQNVITDWLDDIANVIHLLCE
jgi:hypothetical protein